METGLGALPRSVQRVKAQTRQGASPASKREDEIMSAIYIVWYRRHGDSQDGIWGIYDSLEKAIKAEADAKELSFTAWINKEAVH